MNNETTLTVQRRTKTGTGPNRRLRARGFIPAVVYGSDLEPLAIEVEDRVFGRLVRSAGEHAVFLLHLEGTEQQRHAMIREIQYEATTGRRVHVDFQRVMMDQAVRVKVPLELVGVPNGVKNDGGVLDFVTRELEVECLPGQIPDHLVLEVSELRIGQHLEASALALPEGIKLIDSSDRVIVSVSAPKMVAAATTEEGLLEKVAAEPEVIHRGKAEEA